MNKLIITTVFTALFLLSACSIKAEIIAGGSAPLTHQSFIADKDVESIKEKELKIIIESVLSKYNSPLTGESESFIKACIKYQINCYLLPSIAGLESTFGKFIYPNSYNPFGWGRGYIMFANWSEGIETVAKGLKNGYVKKGAETIEEIGSIYAESPTWAIRVNWFIKQFEKEEEKLTLLSDQFPVQL